MTVSQRRFVLSLLVVAVAGLPLLGQEADLTWKFTKDKAFYETMTTTTRQTMKVQGNDVVQDQSQTFYFSWVPKEVDEKANKVVLTQQITGLKMNITIGGSKITYDSTSKENPTGTTNPLNKFFDTLKGATFTVTLDTKNMKVTDIAGHDEFVKKLSDANPQMKPLLEKILSKKALQDMAEPLFAALPGGKTAKGKDWSRDTSLDMGPIGSYTTKYGYKYEGPDKDKNEKIAVTTKLEYKAPTGQDGGNLPFKIKTADLKSKNAKGSVLFDVKKGRLEKSEQSLELEGNLDIEISGMSTKVELKQKQETTVTTSDQPQVKKSTP